MEPEIARRCQTCGASVRGAARFCPQCGQTMSDERDDAGAEANAARAQPRAKSALVDQAERVANSLSGRLAAREPGVTAAATATAPVEDVVSLDPEPIATTHAVQSLAMTEAQEPGASARADAPGGRVNAPAAEVAPEAEDAARAPVETSRADERGAPSVPTQGALADPVPGTSEAQAESAGDGRGAGGVRRRAAAVGESVRPRVEKLREASVVVFDEAAEDPGMRFVVIAAFLFVVALLILLFSFVLR